MSAPKFNAIGLCCLTLDVKRWKDGHGKAKEAAVEARRRIESLASVVHSPTTAAYKRAAA